MAIGQASCTFRDAKGQTARISWYTTYTADADRDTADLAVAVALIALSNAHNSSRTGGAPSLPDATYGTAAVYENAQDKAQLLFRAADGTFHRYQVPAPKSAIFLADGQTVDASNGLVTALVTAMTTASTSARVTTRSGSNISSLIAGVRVRRRVPRRLSLMLKGADDVVPAE